ncbi:hypothetical protein LOTGIDRAFT_173158 [Lottia gigantea]|uniref:Uncharacterized protein n=1 Tax=Lottia gigantea TaxID=225164 RepID=V4B2B2_LOTGI|nr:hypothetical protein LOTGIDRAFT_173158 [Lottia gigantea]ESP00427.1 hypothetical protein LOTGIDRAFT_173158 [Lottia gigantea]
MQNQDTSLIDANISYHVEHLNHNWQLKDILLTKGYQEAKNFHIEKFEELSKKPKNQFSENLTHNKGLLKELKAHLHDIEIPITIEPYDHTKTGDEAVKNIVINCDRFIKQAPFRSIKEYVTFGLWLQKLYILNHGDFESIPINELTISVSWSRKLRKLAKLCDKYPRFQNLTISISKLLTQVLKIERELERTSAEEQAFWKRI